jgi:hypothetical protein
MPLFEKLKLLFIHIPKTGGTSIEDYFFSKYAIHKNVQSLYGYHYDRMGLMFRNKTKNNRNTVSLQHHTWRMLQEKKLIKNSITYKILTVVRNPYNRIISELFYHKVITKDMTPETVYSKIYDYLHLPNTIDFDNHRIPQYQFLIDENGNMIKDIIILKTETLTQSMRDLGYSDFPEIKKNATVSVSNIHDYLNADSIKLINTYYEKDFEYFDYEREPWFPLEPSFNV